MYESTNVRINEKARINESTNQGIKGSANNWITDSSWVVEQGSSKNWWYSVPHFVHKLLYPLRLFVYSSIPMPIYLKNPHSVLAVMEKRPQDVIEVRLSSGQVSGAWTAVRDRAEEIGVRVYAGARQGRSRGGNAEAVIKECPGCGLAELFADCAGLFLALDTVQDPQNLGAIFRSAAFFGVRGILLTRRRSASLTGAACDVASGGVEYVPFSVQTNLSRALDVAKDVGLWILGTSEYAEQELGAFSADRPWLLVLGNEETGMRRLTRDKCDEVCRIAPRGAIGSLNVAAAAAVCIHHFQKG